MRNHEKTFKKLVDSLPVLVHLSAVNPNQHNTTQHNKMTETEYRELELTKAQVDAQLRRHGISPEEFYDEQGDHSFYKGADVLNWLGY